ncbi:hypothetical protein K501DRAFT_184467 [Backusella circina FSU 941]|nr:hypothetical protein K501DRAFT_184467 [Backusella circina FSU 941]
MQLDDYRNKKWISVPLRKCLVSVCSSCPDQLMNNDTAIYSANFEESATVENWSPLHDSRSKIIWEGHGLLSKILEDDNNPTHVTGKITDSSLPAYECSIEVLIQLHPIRNSPLQTTEKAHSLPSVRSLWSDVGKYPERNTPPSPRQQFPAIQYPVQQQRNVEPLNSNTPYNLPFPSTLLPRNSVKDEPIYPPALDPNWPGSRYDADSFDRELIKKRRFSDISSKKPQPNSTTDTYYHQSRRKKRDTKPPNANDIRPFAEVEKDKNGQYILPAEVDSWTVLGLGNVVWDRAAFHNQRYIYPVGYRVKKWYRSMVDPHSDTQYTCEILDGGDEPIFQLCADDNPSECWRGPTPTTVWTIAVRRAFAIRNMDYGHNPVGPDFFGLRKNTIAKMIQDLPNADKCKNYIWQNFEAMNSNKGKSVRRSNTRLSSSSSAGSLSEKSPQQQPFIKSEGSPSSTASTLIENNDAI